MKILEKADKVVYRFRCNKCMSRFEVTQREKVDNDWKYGDKKRKSKDDTPHNPLDKFFCPVCNTVRYGHDVKKVYVMDNGNEVSNY